ncbi:hypothetical protein CLF_108185, partial [Clonorchis sinensis]
MADELESVWCNPKQDESGSRFLRRCVLQNRVKEFVTAIHQTGYGSRGTVIATPYLGPWTAPYMNLMAEESLADVEHADGVLIFKEEEKVQLFLSELTKVFQSFDEVKYVVSVLRCEKAPGPDGLYAAPFVDVGESGLYPALFVDVRESLVTHLLNFIALYANSRGHVRFTGLSVLSSLHRMAS